MILRRLHTRTRSPSNLRTHGDPSRFRDAGIARTMTPAEICSRLRRVSSKGRQPNKQERPMRTTSQRIQRTHRSMQRAKQEALRRPWILLINRLREKIGGEVTHRSPCPRTEFRQRSEDLLRQFQIYPLREAPGVELPTVGRSQCDHDRSTKSRRCRSDAECHAKDGQLTKGAARMAPAASLRSVKTSPCRSQEMQQIRCISADRKKFFSGDSSKPS